MSEDRFDVYLLGFDPAHPETPRQGLARVFGLDGAQSAELLVSLPRVVKRNLAARDARRYLLALESFGGRAELRPGVAVSAEMRAVAPSMPPLRWGSDAPAAPWVDPVAAMVDHPVPQSVPPPAAFTSGAPPPGFDAAGSQPAPASPSMPPRASSAPPPPDWIATAELGSRHPPRSAPAPSMPLRAGYRRFGWGSLSLGALLLITSYAAGESSLYGPPQLLGLLLDGSGLFFVGRGLIRLLVLSRA